nr:hypothetical protein [Arthrobacter glacialis]
MTTSVRLHHWGTALVHPFSPSAWRNSMRLRPADALLAPAIKVGIAATLVLVTGGLLGHHQLAAMAALGALTSAFGRYQSYGRLGRQLAVVAAGLLMAAGVGALLGTVGTPLWLQIAVLSLIAGGAAHLFTALGITGPGPVILVFAASAGAGYAHSPTEIAHVIAAVGIGSLVGWVVAVAPVLVFPLGPARLATARAIAAVGRLRKDGIAMHDDGSNSAAAQAAIANARTTIALSIRARSGQSARTAAVLRQANQLSALMDEADAALAALGTDAFAAALANLARHEAALRTFRRAPEFAAGTGVRGGHRWGSQGCNTGHDAPRGRAGRPGFKGQPAPGVANGSGLCPGRLGCRGSRPGSSVVGIHGCGGHVAGLELQHQCPARHPTAGGQRSRCTGGRGPAVLVAGLLALGSHSGAAAIRGGAAGAAELHAHHHCRDTHGLDHDGTGHPFGPGRRHEPCG